MYCLCMLISIKNDRKMQLTVSMSHAVIWKNYLLLFDKVARKHRLLFSFSSGKSLFLPQKLKTKHKNIIIVKRIWIITSLSMKQRKVENERKNYDQKICGLSSEYFVLLGFLETIIVLCSAIILSNPYFQEILFSC